MTDKTGRNTIVDSKLEEARANSKTLMYNEMLDQSEKSTFQISETQIKSEKEEILKFKTTRKNHATMVPKTLNPIYLEHIAFLMKRGE